MKIKFSKDYLGNKAGAVSYLSDDQAKAVVDAGVGEAVAADPKDLQDAVDAIQKSLDQQLEAACQKNYHPRD